MERLYGGKRGKKALIEAGALKNSIFGPCSARLAGIAASCLAAGRSASGECRKLRQDRYNALFLSGMNGFFSIASTLQDSSARSDRDSFLFEGKERWLARHSTPIPTRPLERKGVMAELYG
ncbi:MAG TPA: hypothetical protein VFB54_08540 [Burkholderiales bacterium]|nr:hypothetical protein [Burkholderiales bacterium]